MRFLRHLAVVVLAVAVVVLLLGLAWNHFAAGTLASTLRGRPGQQAAVPGHWGRSLPPGAVRTTGGIRIDGPQGGMDLGLTSMLDPVNLPYLRHTVVIEAGVIAAVVIIDVGRRKWRRARTK